MAVALSRILFLLLLLRWLLLWRFCAPYMGVVLPSPGFRVRLPLRVPYLLCSVRRHLLRLFCLLQDFQEVHPQVSTLVGLLLRQSYILTNGCTQSSHLDTIYGQAKFAPIFLYK